MLSNDYDNIVFLNFSENSKTFLSLSFFKYSILSLMFFSLKLSSIKFARESAEFFLKYLALLPSCSKCTEISDSSNFIPSDLASSQLYSNLQTMMVDELLIIH